MHHLTLALARRTAPPRLLSTDIPKRMGCAHEPITAVSLIKVFLLSEKLLRKLCDVMDGSSDGHDSEMVMIASWVCQARETKGGLEKTCQKGNRLAMSSVGGTQVYNDIWILIARRHQSLRLKGP